MNGTPQSQHEAELAAQSMQDKVNGANSHCCLSSGSQPSADKVKMPKETRAKLQKLIDEQVPMPAEFGKVLDEEFFDLI